MRTVITLNNSRQDAATEEDQVNTPFPQSEDQSVIETMQNKSSTQHQLYSEPDSASVAFTDTSGADPSMQMAEEDMYDPDLAVNLVGTRSYLQPG